MKNNRADSVFFFHSLRQMPTSIIKRAKYFFALLSVWLHLCSVKISENTLHLHERRKKNQARKNRFTSYSFFFARFYCAFMAQTVLLTATHNSIDNNKTIPIQNNRVSTFLSQMSDAHTRAHAMKGTLRIPYTLKVKQWTFHFDMWPLFRVLLFCFYLIFSPVICVSIAFNLFYFLFSNLFMNCSGCLAFDFFSLDMQLVVDPFCNSSHSRLHFEAHTFVRFCDGFRVSALFKCYIWTENTYNISQITNITTNTKNQIANRWKESIKSRLEASGSEKKTKKNTTTRRFLWKIDYACEAL